MMNIKALLSGALFSAVLLAPHFAFGSYPNSTFSGITLSNTPTGNGIMTGGSVSGTALDGGTVISRTMSARAKEVFNVKDYGAAGDAKSLSPCAVAASSSSVTCIYASFSANDVGKQFYFQGAGASGTPLTGTIASFVNAKSVTINATATTATPAHYVYSPVTAPIVITDGGSGYAVNDTITLSCGSPITAAVLTVASVSSGAVTGISVANKGLYTAYYSGLCTQGSTSGSGTGATFTLSTYQGGGKFIYGTDDTAAVSSAITAANGTGGTVYFPAGSYWLASQSSAITLNNIAIKGQGIDGYSWPYTAGGSNILISNQTTQAFSGMQGVDWDGVSVFYPLQDGTQETPIAYPPLWQSGNFTNDTFRNFRVINAYDLMKIDTSAATGGGRVVFSNVRAYCIDSCIWALDGVAGYVRADATTVFGISAADGLGVYGPAMLDAWTQANGEAIRLDMGSGGYPNFDGLEITGGFTFGYKYGVRVLSGKLDVSGIKQWTFDQVQTALSIEGNATAASLSISGGQIYSINLFDATQANPVFNFSSSVSAGSHVMISGVNVFYAQGNVLFDSTGSLGSLEFGVNKLANFGKSTTSANYYGVKLSVNNIAGTVNVAGNHFHCNTGANIIGGALVQVGGAGAVDISGNIFDHCNWAVVTQGGSGKINISGNASLSTNGSPLQDSTTGTALVTDAGNSWDKNSNILHIGDVVSSASGLTAAGSNQSDALILNAATNAVANVPSGTGVALANPQPGMCQSVQNGGGNALQIYAQGSSTINGTAGATGIPLATGKMGRFCATSTSAWFGGAIN